MSTMNATGGDLGSGPASLTRERRFLEVCVQFEDEFLAGRRPEIEAIAHRLPHGPDRDELIRELVAIEVELRRRRGDTPTPEEYHERFPAITAPLDLHGGSTGLDPGTGERERFRVVRERARGGLGEVYVAFDTELNREVALKEIRNQFADDPQSRARFILEAEVTGRLEHPGIVPVYSLGRRAGGRPYYAMRLIEGRTLHDAISSFHAPESRRHADQSALALRELLGRFVAVCQAIAFAHSRGVLHRDLKPSNVMLGDYGETLVVDWGLAKALGERPEPGKPAEDASRARPLAEAPLVPSSGSDVAPTEGATGTPAYMSPEQADGLPADPAVDIYGLGSILYAVLAGRAPVSGATVAEILERVRRGVIVPPRQVGPDVHRALEAICLKALAHDPRARYVSARALAEDVERWLADEPVSAWREPWTTRIRRWIARHRTIVAATSAAAMVAALAGASIVDRWRSTSTYLVGQLESAAIDKVPPILEQLDGYHWWADARLAAGFARSPEGSAEKLRQALGLLKGSSAPTDYVIDRLLNAKPGEVVVIRDELIRTGRARTLEARLWEILGAPPATGDPGVRLRAACGLAHSADDTRWEALADEVVAGLLRENRVNPVGIQDWSKALIPLMPRLVTALNRFYGQEDAPTTGRALVAGLLKDHARRPEDLVAALVAAGPEDFETFFEELRARDPEARAHLSEAAGNAPANAPPAPVSNELEARRQARATIALARLGETDALWPRLRHGPDPTRRSYVIDLIATLGGDPHAIAAHLPQERDPSVVRALLMALGRFGEDRFPTALRGELATSLAPRYRDDPDPGVHSSVDWLLRQWKLDAEFRRIDAELAGKPPGGRSWYVSPGGITFVIIRNPAPFFMGGLPDEPGYDDEVRHRRAIGRSFAIATREVTVAEFREFAEANPRVFEGDRPYVEMYSPEENCPANGLNWRLAAMYCRWLSDAEHLPDGEKCYPALKAILEAEMKKGGAASLGTDDVLRRTGYRLPTEAEWEYACRAGALSIWPFGRGPNLLPRYAWFIGDSGDRTHPVGMLLPNDLGLFDMLGNVRELCHEPYRKYKIPAASGVVADDQPAKEPGADPENRPRRGGSLFDPLERSRPAMRMTDGIDNRQVNAGLRLVRTWTDTASAP